MRRYIIKRILQIIPILVGVIIINFTILHLAPGDPAHVMGGERDVPPEYYVALREKMGLDKPIWQQLLIYMGNVLKGDLGYSWINRRPVLDVIFERFPATILLMGTSVILAIVLGTLIGVLSSSRPYSKIDNVNTVMSLVGYSIPNFWLGVMLIIVFGVWLRWLPISGMTSLTTEKNYIIDVISHMILPAACLTTQNIGYYVRLSRTSMLEVLKLDYITTARAKGCKERTVLFKHALRNALLPIVTSAGFELGFVIAGSSVTETVFGWPGVGMLMIRSIYYRDYPVLLGIFLIISLFVTITNFITDISYAYLDPRIKIG
ncbi:MAG: ABC transporter permease [Candidatus Bathyarchaeota archaeon]|nr:ABC transporter permease [Candidatus Bathyarchaeota archaeon]